MLLYRPSFKTFGSYSFYWGGYNSVTYEAMIPKYWRSLVQVVKSRYRSGVLWHYEPLYGRSVVQDLVVIVDIGVVTYEAMTSRCERSLVQVLFVLLDIGVVTHEAMTPQCGRSVFQVLVVTVDIGVVTYEAMTPQCGRSVVQVLGCQSGYRSGDL